MPVSYEIHADQGYVLAIYQGEVTQSQVVEMFRAYQADPEFDMGLAHMADLSQLTSANVGFSEIFSLFSLYARTYRALGRTMRNAIYAPDETVFGLTRIYENLAETSDTIEVRIFDDFEAARAWACAPKHPPLSA